MAKKGKGGDHLGRGQGREQGPGGRVKPGQKGAARATLQSGEKSWDGGHGGGVGWGDAMGGGGGGGGPD